VPTTNLERCQRIAALHDLLDLRFGYGRYRRVRPRLFAGLSGRLLEVGVGTGRNMPFYPPGSTVLAIDLSPAMLARAERRRPLSHVPVELRQMDVTRLELPDGSFNAAVASFVFCVLPEELQAAAFREPGRVVKPGGSIRLLEYTRPQDAFRRALIRLWEPWIAWACGAGFDRRTEEHARAVGLDIVRTSFVVSDLIKPIEARLGPGAIGRLPPHMSAGQERGSARHRLPPPSSAAASRAPRPPGGSPGGTHP
jgi:ubiquinone/menaquinone biosynthesis C-methylase UbiE